MTAREPTHGDLMFSALFGDGKVPEAGSHLLDALSTMAREYSPHAHVRLTREAVSVVVGREVIASGDSVRACLVAMSARNAEKTKSRKRKGDGDG